MPTALFASKPGVVGVYQDLEVLPCTIHIYRDDLAVQFEHARVMKAILTSFDAGLSGAVSTNLTLRQKIYVTVVGGENPGVLRLGGLWFSGICPGDSGPTGLDAVWAFYEQTRVSTTGRTVRVTAGRTLSLVGVVREFQARLADPATGVGEFVYTIDHLPRGVLTAAQPFGQEANLTTGSPLAVLGQSAIAGATR